MEQLPRELVQKILKNLPEKDIVKCTTVCKLFNELITSYKMIKKLFIRDSCDSSIPAFNRQYFKVIIQENDAEKIAKALQAIGEHVLEVKFENHTSTLESIARAVNYLPKVTKITFDYLRLENTNEDEVIRDIIQPLPYNIEVVFIESDLLIFKIVRNLNFHKLRIGFYDDSPFSNLFAFFGFIVNQKELKSLTLSGYYGTALILGLAPASKYHLAELEVSNCDFEDEWDLMSIYIDRHSESLEKLTLKSLNYDPFAVIPECKQLKVLELDDIELQEFHNEFKNIEQLSIGKGQGVILDKFPSLKKLSLKQATAETNRLIHGSKIEELSVVYGTVADIRCENLKKLSLQNIEEPMTEEFFRNHSKVINLKLENIFELDDTLLEAVVRNMPGLEKLAIYGLNNLSGQSFEIMAKYCKQLRVLDMRTWSQRYSSKDWKCLFDSNNGIEIYVENFDF